MPLMDTHTQNGELWTNCHNPDADGHLFIIIIVQRKTVSERTDHTSVCYSCVSQYLRLTVPEKTLFTHPLDKIDGG